MPEFPSVPDSTFGPPEERLPKGVRVALSCPPLRLLLAHREGVLPEEGEAEIAGHLERCGVCQMLLADLEHPTPPGLSQREQELMRNKLAVPLAAGRKSWRWYAVAGAVAAVLLLGYFLAVHPSITAPSRTTQNTQAAQATQPKQPKASASKPELPEIEVAKLAPPLDLSPGLVLRGATPGGEPSANDLAPAFDSYAKNDYAAAAEHFDLLAKEFPRAEVPVLYLGVTQLLMQDDKAALASLSRADKLATNGRKDAAEWYLAVAAARTHDPEAPGLLRDLCRRDKSPYAAQACSLKAKL